MERQRKTFAQLLIERIVQQKTKIAKLIQKKNDTVKLAQDDICLDEDMYAESYNDCHSDYFDAN